MQRLHTSSVALPGSLCHHCRQCPRLQVTQPSIDRSACKVRCERQSALLKRSTAGRFPIVTAHASAGSEGPGLAQDATDSAEAAGESLPEASATPSLAEQIHAAACEEVELPIGRLSIGPIQAGEEDALAVLVTRAFAGTPEVISFPTIRSHIDLLSQDPAESIVLVGRLTPSDSRVTLPPGATQRLAGSVMLSFGDRGRETFESLQPPSEYAYLSNTAVDAALHRQGIARAILRVAHRVCQAAGHSGVTLHARLADEAALQLYKGEGYEEVGRDGWSLLRRYRPRALLLKRFE